MHLLRYEDMHRDPHAAFAAVAAFLGLPSDRERVAAAVDAASFSRLQAQEQAAGFVEKPIKAAAFFREGRVDGWRQVLTAEQNARIVDANEPVMRRLGYDTALRRSRQSAEPHSQSPRLRFCRDHVEGDADPRAFDPAWLRGMRHIGRKQHEPAGHRLDLARAPGRVDAVLLWIERTQD